MLKLLVTISLLIAFAADIQPAHSAGEWMGHDFAFCFVTDDGTRSNLALADTARVMDFRFTIAVNINSDASHSAELTRSEVYDLWADGFEIGQHGGSHANRGLSEECLRPPRGSLMGYFLCTDPGEDSRMISLAAEIERDTIMTWTGIPASDIRVVAYPRHRHGSALIDSLIADGFIGARTGGKFGYEVDSYGEFTTLARNSWDGGVSLYRIPTRTTDAYLFGNHSAIPPVHKSYDQFREIAELTIAPFQNIGGICVIYTHHLGNDNDSLGDINYDTGGVTKQDLAWLIDFVREKNGLVMTLGDAISYYRARSHMENIDGDLVWMPGTAASAIPEASFLNELQVYPNPFNPSTQVSLEIGTETRLKVQVFDLRGRRVVILADRVMSAGQHTMSWNGRDTVGALVSAGTYVVTASAGKEMFSSLVSLIK